MQNKLTVYLAGAMQNCKTLEEMNSWRLTLSSLLRELANTSDCDLKIINPVFYYNFEKKRHKSEAEVMDFDLLKVKSSDILLVNLDGLSTSDGTKFEMYESWRKGIPVIAFGYADTYENLHPWIKRLITRYDNTMEEMTLYINDFYMS